MNLFGAFTNKLHKRAKLNDKGSAIVIVIIAMGMIGILAATILWTTYINYMIKLNDKQTKDNFYSAENVVEQIMAGMKNEASYAAVRGYKQVMAKWSDDVYEINRQLTFNNAYRNALAYEFITDTSAFDATGNVKQGGPYTYDRKKLLKFTEINEDDWTISLKDSKGNIDKYKVDKNFWNGTGWSQYSTGEASDYSDAYIAEPIVEVTGSTLVFRNIGVKVTNDREYVSIVTTDIVIEAPQVTFTQEGEISEFYDYSLIADEGIYTTTSAGIVGIEGSVYAGDLDGLKTDEEVKKNGLNVFKFGSDTDKLTRSISKGGINIAQGTEIRVSNAKYLVSGGDINLNGTGSRLSVAKPKEGDTKIYTKNFNLDSGHVDLVGRIYASDDLTLDGNGSSAVVKGAYYGYGDATNEDPDHSSAIIVNGTKSTVDFKNVSSLLLAGRAYISGVTNNQIDPDTNVKKMDTDENNPVIMGESIAVKGGQIAYMVPAEAIGILDKTTHKTAIGMNPLNIDYITKLENYKTKYPDTFAVVDIDKPIYSLKGKTLREYISIDSKTKEPMVREVNVQYVSSNKDDKTMRYYYMVMTPENAEKYFKDYYSNVNNKKAIDNYFKTYASGGIILGDYTDDTKTEYTILGNALLTSALSESGVNLVSGLKKTPVDPATPEDPLAPSPTPMPEDEIEIIDDQAEELEDALSSTDVVTVIGNITSKYQNLCETLNENYASVDDTVTDYLARTTQDEVITAADGTEICKGLRDYLSKNGGTVTFKNGKYTAVFTNKDISVSSLDANTRIIVAVNNADGKAKDSKDFVGPTVTLDRNYNGIIISEGQIKISSSAQVKLDKQGVYLSLLGTRVGASEGDADFELKALDFFSDSGTLLNGAEDINTKLDWSSIVYYNNWYKK